MQQVVQQLPQQLPQQVVQQLSHGRSLSVRGQRSRVTAKATHAPPVYALFWGRAGASEMPRHRPARPLSGRASRASRHVDAVHGGRSPVTDM
eukprot:8374478-Alexandrium_andersonii.AAC.1